MPRQCLHNGAIVSKDVESMSGEFRKDDFTSGVVVYLLVVLVILFSPVIIIYFMLKLIYYYLPNNRKKRKEEEEKKNLEIEVDYQMQLHEKEVKEEDKAKWDRLRVLQREKDRIIYKKKAEKAWNDSLNTFVKEKRITPIQKEEIERLVLKYTHEDSEYKKNNERARHAFIYQKEREHEEKYGTIRGHFDGHKTYYDVFHEDHWASVFDKRYRMNLENHRVYIQHWSIRKKKMPKIKNELNKRIDPIIKLATYADDDMSQKIEAAIKRYRNLYLKFHEPLSERELGYIDNVRANPIERGYQFDYNLAMTYPKEELEKAERTMNILLKPVIIAIRLKLVIEGIVEAKLTKKISNQSQSLSVLSEIIENQLCCKLHGRMGDQYCNICGKVIPKEWIVL